MLQSKNSGKSRRGFTLVGLLSVLTVLSLLLAVLCTEFVQRSENVRRTKCLANVRQLARAMQLYTDDNRDIFPDHRNQNDSDSTVRARTNWWGTTILKYANYDTKLYRCPELQTTRRDRGVTWSWAFDVHRAGYGYNGFFLGISPYPVHGIIVKGISFEGFQSLKRSSIVAPAENLLFADSQPYGTPAAWGSVLWWPNACMDTKSSTSRAYEGAETLRHGGVAATAFNDGHVEWRRDSRINPPVDPSSGNPRGIINSRFWDPLQRSDE